MSAPPASGTACPIRLPDARRAAGIPAHAGTLTVGAGAVLVLWMATRPYQGIIHDSRLYTLLASRLADPARFAPDLFLQFGSQDRFTVFSYVYAPVLAAFGPGVAAMALTAVAQALWLGAASWLAWALLRDRVMVLLALAGLAVLPSTYGGYFTFSFGEAFVTPRLFAEAATLAAFGFVVRGRLAPAALALMGAVAFHPIMTLPGAAVFLLYAGHRNRAWWVAAACAAAAGAGLCLLGVEPFARLGVRLDPEWLGIVHHRAAETFVTWWSEADGVILASEAAMALAILRGLDAPGRRLVQAVLAVAAGGLGVSLAGADLLHDQLLLNLQPWRATWLLGAVSHLLAFPALVTLARTETATHPFARPLVFGGAFFLLAARFLPVSYVWAALLLAAGVIYQRRGANTVRLPPRAWLLAAAIGGVGVTTYLVVSLMGTLPLPTNQRWAALRNFVLCILGLGLVASSLNGNWTTRPGIQAGRALVVAALLAVAVLGWDGRDAWTRFTETGTPPPDDLAGFVPEGATVYWGDGLGMLWLRLRHPSYYSCLQGSGVIFFRETAIAYAHRRESFRFEPDRGGVCKPPDDVAPMPASLSELKRACAREPQLDYIVVPDLVAGVPATEWVSPASRWDLQMRDGSFVLREISRYYRYGCRELGRPADREP